MLQKVRVFPAELQVLPHVLDTVLDGVRDIQSQVDLAETRKVTITGDVQEQVLGHHGGLGDTPVTEVEDSPPSIGDGIEHEVVH